MPLPPMSLTGGAGGAANSDATGGYQSAGPTSTGAAFNNSGWTINYGGGSAYASGGPSTATPAGASAAALSMGGGLALNPVTLILMALAIVWLTRKH